MQTAPLLIANQRLVDVTNGLIDMDLDFTGLDLTPTVLHGNLHEEVERLHMVTIVTVGNESILGGLLLVVGSFGYSPLRLHMIGSSLREISNGP